MMYQNQKHLAEQQSREIKAYDQSRDLPLAVGIIIGAFSVATSATSVLSSFAVFSLEAFRTDVDSVWMACVPFVFPVVTGIATTYRRQLSNIGVHICLIFATSVIGCVGFGYSIDPVYHKMDNCTEVVRKGYYGDDCRKESLVFIYLIAGGVTIFLALCGLGTSVIACGIALRRRKVRLEENPDQELATGNASETPKHTPIYKGNNPDSRADENRRKDDAIVLLRSFDV